MALFIYIHVLCTVADLLHPATAVLTLPADGDEGGRHQLVSATVSGGKLWICKIQVGDKRWFKGAKKEALGAFNSFTVA